VDLAGAVRVSRRVELRDIRLAEIAASSPSHYSGSLRPQVEHECSATKREDNAVEVICSYRFHALSDQDEQVLDASITYQLTYTIGDNDPIDESDLDHFAFASGTLHSWPFVRQLLFGLTGEMGFPPFTLPVHKHQPAKSTAVAPPTVEEQTNKEEPVEANSDAR
jgi:preprotein translocase subunit SecB